MIHAHLPSMNEKFFNTNRGVNFDPLSSSEVSSHDDSSPPRKVNSLRDFYDSCTFSLKIKKNV